MSRPHANLIPSGTRDPGNAVALAKAGKRMIDVAVSLTALLLALPLLAGIALAVWVGLGRPVFYGQTRPGLDGRLFKLWKFRTMTLARTATGELLADAQRLTPLGLWLRRHSLDELPQLFNVLTGNLSLVGPRPLLVRYLPRYTPSQHRRHWVKPGITGWAQINGRNTADWDARFEADQWYVEHWSLGLDLRILARTALALALARRRDVLPGGGSEFDEFWGPAGPPAQGPRAFPVEADESLTTSPLLFAEEA